MRKEYGFTIVETLITMLLSAIMVLIIGFIVFSANSNWISNWTKIQAENDMRYAKRRVEFMLRNASSDPFCAKGSGNESYGDGVEVGDAVEGLQFNGNDLLKVENGELLYQHNGVTQEVILRNVSDWQMHVFYGSEEGEAFNKKNHSYMKMYLYTRQQGAGNSGIVTTSCTFIVKNRNNGN